MQRNQNGIAYTTDSQEAQKYRVEDTRDTAKFCKDEDRRKRLLANGSWVNMYTRIIHCQCGQELKNLKDPCPSCKSTPRNIPQYFILPAALHTTKEIPRQFSFDIPGITLHEHQNSMVKFVEKIYGEGKKSAFIIAGTGTGKTYGMLAITQLLGLSTVIVTPNSTISKLVYDDFSKYVDSKIIKGSKDVELTKVNIMCHQTFNKIYDQINGKVDLLAIDECFVAGTKVDGRNIEDIKIGDYVRSFNHTTNKVEYKKVLHTFKKPATKLCKLTSQGRTIVCTPDHPFRDGLAYNVQKDRNMMFYIIPLKNEYMYTMLKRIGMVCSLAKKRFQENLKNILLKGMLLKFQKKEIVGNNETNESEILLGKNEEKQSYEKGDIKRENENNTKIDVTQTDNTGMKLKTTPSTTTAFVSSIMTTYRVCSSYIREKMMNISDLLQDRYSKLNIKNLNRSGLSKSWAFKKERTGQKEDGVFRTEMTNNIEVLEQTSDGTFGGMCKDSYVYNLEVETHNNYFVEDVLVHNCHHIPETRVKQINLWKGRFVVGLTATAIRKEFGLEGFAMLFGSILDTDTEALPIKLYYHTFRYDYNQDEFLKASEGLAPDSPEMYRRLVIDNDVRNEELVDIIKKFIGIGKKHFIVFSDRVDHIIKTADYLKTRFANVYEYRGDSDKEKVISEFNQLDGGIIVGNLQACGEGFNIKKLEVGILYVSTQRTVTCEQAAGRVRRVYGDKKEGIFVDFVDNISFNGSNTKQLGWYERKKIYARKGRALNYI